MITTRQPEGNPLEYPSPDILRLGGREVFRYLRQQYRKRNPQTENATPKKVENILYPRGMGEIIEWLAEGFKNNPIESVSFNNLSHTITGALTVSCKVQLRDKTSIEGTLSFMASDNEWKSKHCNV